MPGKDLDPPGHFCAHFPLWTLCESVAESQENPPNGYFHPLPHRFQYLDLLCGNSPNPVTKIMFHSFPHFLRAYDFYWFSLFLRTEVLKAKAVRVSQRKPNPLPGEIHSSSTDVHRWPHFLTRWHHRQSTYVRGTTKCSVSKSSRRRSRRVVDFSMRISVGFQSPIMLVSDWPSLI